MENIDTRIFTKSILNRDFLSNDESNHLAVIQIINLFLLFNPAVLTLFSFDHVIIMIFFFWIVMSPFTLILYTLQSSDAYIMAT